MPHRGAGDDLKLTLRELGRRISGYPIVLSDEEALSVMVDQSTSDHSPRTIACQCAVAASGSSRRSPVTDPVVLRDHGGDDGASVRRDVHPETERVRLPASHSRGATASSTVS